ncbi:alpha/beta fold hydrolase [Pararhodobacter zhoushanensis]|uniref:Alpha/beta hydrolase n=1 Tax=Pararhodobacter zhoushanensis TaxID=2479545 RepID=A0ABT3GXQ8_9RHOB|nr:alpha/beta hydrolase [Pararhodobacter zhoushanensis]MCW1932293.1 alpha/beta hydrolase [Pararhodobacter zhoushanensis]
MRRVAELAVETTGEGAPALVFLHGFSLDRRSWAPQIAAFSQDHHCVAYDLRGFGDSPPPQGDYDHAADLAAVIADKVTGPYVLIGLSLGANVALALSAQRPAGLAGLVLASSGLFGHDWQGEERPPAAADRVAADQGVEAARAFWLAHPLFASLDNWPEARAQAHHMVAAYSGWHWQAPGRGARIAPVRALSDVAVPTLVLSGERDVAGYRAIASALAQGIPDARLERLPGAGHLCNLEDPAQFNAAVQAFLTSLVAKEETA